ncbi:hypothetical protein KAW96_04905 [candidate division WOR-3 bacterium]|nr:hypothetical protein [candidate division WOR-3 bacterium]
MKREAGLFEKKNKLICGDNLEILPTIENESVDLIYIDPHSSATAIK